MTCVRIYIRFTTASGVTLFIVIYNAALRITRTSDKYNPSIFFDNHFIRNVQKLRKATISFNVSACPSVRTEHSAHAGRIFIRQK